MINMPLMLPQVELTFFQVIRIRICGMGSMSLNIHNHTEEGLAD